MKLLSKRVIVPKSYDTVCHILKSSAYHFPKVNFNDEDFLMYYTKHFKGSIISRIPVRGSIAHHNGSVEITLSIDSGFGIYLSCFLCLIGIIGLFWCIISNSNRWIPCVGSILLGVLVGGQFLWEGKDCLEIIERKLLT